MIKIIYQGPDSKKIKADVLKAHDFVAEIFLIKTSKIIVRVHTNRIDFNKILKRATPQWLIANASNDGQIDILSPIVLKNDSSHEAKEFLPILKHEFTHLFVDSLVKGKVVPKWLDEGLAGYLAKQHRHDQKPQALEANFCNKLATPSGWQQRINRGAYSISALFVYFLIKKYSFKKIIKLLTSLNKKYDYPGFKKIFFEVYQKDLSEVEKLFIKELY